MSEFAFELRLCRRLERAGVPGLGSPGVVARQLGTSVHAVGGRIVDVVAVLPGPEFDARVRLTPHEIPVEAIESDATPGSFDSLRTALPGPPARRTRVLEEGVDAGYLERDRRNGQTVVRAAARYPDWMGGLVGVENKPDLGDPGALEAQLRHDVSLGVLDYAVLATESYVTGAHRNRVPDPVGIWRVHDDGDDDPRIEVVREPTRLAAHDWGLEPLGTAGGRTDVATVTPAEKATQRTRIAERAYGKGWRTFTVPACEHAAARDGLPHCTYLDRVVDAATDCGPECPGFEPAAPLDLDPAAERARETPWDPDPPGAQRHQAGLHEFD